MPEFIYKYKNAPLLYVAVVIDASSEKVQFSTRLLRMEKTHPISDNQQFPAEPPAITSAIAIEMAIDELAYTLDADPLEYRLKSYAEKNPHIWPWSAKLLRECYIRGREATAWTTRNPKPASTQQGGWLVGYGMATASYPDRRKTAVPDIRSKAIRMNTQYRRPPAGTRPNVPFPDAGSSTLYGSHPAPHGSGAILSGSPRGAIFARVLVDPQTGLVRIARLTAILHIGRVTDIREARDQVISGMTLALNMTRDYIPEQTDMPEFDVRFLDKPDPYISRLNSRDLEETGMTGTIAAVSNAIFHATGRRIRRLPVLPAPLSYQTSDHWSHPAH